MTVHSENEEKIVISPYRLLTMSNPFSVLVYWCRSRYLFDNHCMPGTSNMGTCVCCRSAGCGRRLYKKTARIWAFFVEKHTWNLQRNVLCMLMNISPPLTKPQHPAEGFLDTYQVIRSIDLGNVYSNPLRTTVMYTR